ncbi:DUF1573 domain-containing protein [Flavobacterium sp. SUN052]|uniref:DUF1573 domain-containing protein n=1 Tax=Flavobacterium sp. SUN052 TaxID=3002441 RepID=UPI00237E605E|nr:DUF1573 domain-containing protein [Flavobacterium sp. SUN052]MEC4003902.1 DUF1573 domain-containing protein [Flavobacterium sp. SUN052]
MKILKISLLTLSLGLMSFSTININSNTFFKIKTLEALNWKNELVDVGSIPQGTPKLIVFEFKNTSDKSVSITNVKPACGCTATDYTKDAIAPGKLGYVKATFNAGVVGAFTKTVTVTTTADETPKVLTFKGSVEAKQ